MVRHQYHWSILLFVLAFAFYGAAGAWFWRGMSWSELGKPDTAFDSDPHFGTFAGHILERDLRHPLLDLPVRPLDAVARLFSADSLTRVVAICAFLGALAVFLFHRCFRAISLSPGRGALFSILFAVSPPQLVFSVLPDSFSFTLVALLGLLWITVSATSERVYWITFVPVLALATGLNAACAAYGLLLFLYRFRSRSLRAVIGGATALTFAVTVLLAAGLAVQERGGLAESARELIDTDYSDRWVLPPRHTSPVGNALELAPYAFAYGVIGPDLTVRLVERRGQGAHATTDPQLRSRGVDRGWRGAFFRVLLASLIIGVTAFAVRHRLYRNAGFSTAMIVIGLSLVLFSYFVPKDYFLFTSFFTAPWLLVLAKVHAESAFARAGRIGASGVAATAVILLVVVHNLYWFSVVGRIYRLLAPF